MPRRLSRVLLAGAVLTASAALTPISAAPAAAAANPCKSSAHPRMAKRLGNQIRAALGGRRGTESVAVYDRARRIYCAVDSGRRYDSASVVKAAILGALLRKILDERRRMTRAEHALAHKMITRSDNDAASALWRRVGRTRMKRFVRRAGMAHTALGKGGYWGLTQINAYDQIQLLRRFTTPNRLLTGKARRYALKLMNHVVPAQRWGTPAGRPGAVAWHVKNGWLPRHGRHWRVHSIGAFNAPGRNYMIVVLTRDTPSMAYGVATIERVARAVHRDLNPGARSTVTERVPGGTFEVSDGSVPPHV